METEKPVEGDSESVATGLGLGSDGMEVKKRSRKGLVVAVVVALLAVLLGGGGVAAYFAGWLSFLSFTLGPDEVLDRMYKAVPDIKSAYYDVVVRVNTEARDQGARPIEVQVPAVQVKQEQLKADQQKLNDINKLLPAIKGYKDKGGEGIYYPRALLDVTDERDKERVSGLLASGEYLYKQVNQGHSFEFIVRLDTDEAATAYVAYVDAMGRQALEDLVEVEKTRVIILNEQSENVYVNLSPRDASPYPITGLSYEGLYQYIPVDFDLNFSVGGSGEMGIGAKSSGELKLAGRLKMGGASFEGDVELRKVGDVYYWLVNEFPSFGFFDLAALKGKWVQILPEDDLVRAYRPSLSETEVKEATVVRQYQIIFKLAQEMDVIKVVEEYPRVKEGKRKDYHYEIEIDGERLPAFYRRLAEISKAELGDEGIIEYREATSSYLESDDFKQVYEALRENTKLELWVDDKSFYPTKIKYSARLVPPDSIVKFREKQIMASLSLALSNINKAVSVMEPAEHISVDEAQVLLTGMSADQVKFDRQVQQVRKVKDALKLYKAHAGIFPTSLNDLTSEINDVPVAEGGEETAEYTANIYQLKKLKDDNKPFLIAVPNDAFTNEPYLYYSSETDFALRYQVVFPAPGIPSSYGYDPQEYQQKQYVEGQNTATKEFISVEAREKSQF